MNPLIGAVAGPLMGILEKVIPDPAQREAAVQELVRAQNEPLLKQMEVNAVEATHANTFVSGWRPAVGWIGAVSLFYMSFGRDLVVGILTTLGLDASGFTIPNTDVAIFILSALLGIGGLRTVEKIKGVSK